MKTNTLAWARLWVKQGAPPLTDPPFNKEHHIITAQLRPFRKAYLAATTDEERAAVLLEYGV